MPMPSVLIVDDHVDTCEAVRRIIARMGTPAECVHSGVDALAYLEADQPSLVLLDLTMPEMDGVETLERMRARGFRGAVVMFTAMSDERSRRRAMHAGATDYWVKGSFDPGQIVEMLRRHVTP